MSSEPVGTDDVLTSQSGEPVLLQAGLKHADLISWPQLGGAGKEGGTMSVVILENSQIAVLQRNFHSEEDQFVLPDVLEETESFAPAAADFVHDSLATDNSLPYIKLAQVDSKISCVDAEAEDLMPEPTVNIEYDPDAVDPLAHSPLPPVKVECDPDDAEDPGAPSPVGAVFPAVGCVPNIHGTIFNDVEDVFQKFRLDVLKEETAAILSTAHTFFADSIASKLLTANSPIKQSVFSKQSRLVNKKRDIISITRQHCNLCGESFRDRSSLSHHMLKHGGEKRHQCSECDKSFRFKTSLATHRLKHSRGERPFQCSKCDEAFGYASSLRAHMLEHGDKGQYQCSQCDRTFCIQSRLLKHMLSHSNERPHQCGQCDKSFRQQTTLSSHMLKEHGKGRYQCSLCDKTFSIESVLSRHMMMHTGEKPYRCSQCKMSYSYKCHLVTHMLKHSG